MREIKFRAWDGKEMDYDVGVYNGQVLTGVEDSVWAWNEQPKTPLMQYTGLKDKSGVEIYEGDIVALDFESGKPTLGTIKYAISEFGVEWLNESLLGSFGQRHNLRQLSDSLVAENDLRVIGNIHENPELLKCKRSIH